MSIAKVVGMSSNFNVEELVSGSLIFHQPRGHFYQLVYKTLVKSETGSWIKGWAYRKCENVRAVYDEILFDVDEEAELYTRPFTMFDQDWTLPFAPTCSKS